MNISDSLLLGPTEEQEHLLHCVMQGECKEPLGTGCWTWFYVDVDVDDFWWQLLLRYALKQKNDIIWEFFPNVGPPPTPPFWEPLFQKKI